jgi:hypothetical protein
MFALIRLRFRNKILAPLKAMCGSPGCKHDLNIKFRPENLLWMLMRPRACSFDAQHLAYKSDLQI